MSRHGDPPSSGWRTVYTANGISPHPGVAGGDAGERFDDRRYEFELMARRDVAAAREWCRSATALFRIENVLPVYVIQPPAAERIAFGTRKQERFIDPDFYEERSDYVSTGTVHPFSLMENGAVTYADSVPDYLSHASTEEPERQLMPTDDLPEFSNLGLLRGYPIAPEFEHFYDDDLWQSLISRGDTSLTGE